MSEDGTQSLSRAYERLNERFYTAGPAEHFRTRWFALLALIGRPDEILEILKSGVAYENVHAVIGEGEASPEGIRDYASLESEVLLHQTSECLIRLFLAHAVESGCPWLEVSAERSAWAFKKRVENEILDLPTPDLTPHVCFWFLGSRTCPPDFDPADWEQCSANLVAFLRFFAQRWLTDAPLYNSIKHGLSAVPGQVEMSFASKADLSDARSVGRGTSVEFLDFEKSGKSRVWNLVTRWLDVSETLALSDIARQMIQSLWELGRMRHANGDPPETLFTPNSIGPTSFRSPDRAPGISATFPTGIEETLA